MSAHKQRAVERAAAAAAKERRVSQIRPGWWVFSHGTRDPLGGWGEVTATTRYRDPDTRRPAVLLTVRDRATSRRHEIEQVPSYPAWCCTPAEARRAGLR